METKYGAKLCGCGINIAVAMAMCSRCEIESIKQELSDRTEEMFKVKATLIALVKDPHGCPQCHSGKLIKVCNDHWPDCPYNLAMPYIN
jgi:hypothetical protein